MNTQESSEAQTSVSASPPLPRKPLTLQRKSQITLDLIASKHYDEDLDVSKIPRVSLRCRAEDKTNYLALSVEEGDITEYSVERAQASAVEIMLTAFNQFLPPLWFRLESSSYRLGNFIASPAAVSLVVPNGKTVRFPLMEFFQKGHSKTRNLACQSPFVQMASEDESVRLHKFLQPTHSLTQGDPAANAWIAECTSPLVSVIVSETFTCVANTSMFATRIGAYVLGYKCTVSSIDLARALKHYADFYQNKVLELMAQKYEEKDGQYVQAAFVLGYTDKAFYPDALYSLTAPVSLSMRLSIYHRDLFPIIYEGRLASETE